jgi:GH25 family lysozyme M1 (1,4-beta-N-acetylmuramidase)
MNMFEETVSPVRATASRRFRRASMPWLIMGCTLYFVPGRAMAQRPLGLDVSHYQGAINWASVKSAGYTFAWAKATEGGSGSPDAFFAGNISGAKAAGVYIGAYHFAHPEANSPATEADFFWSVAGGSITNDGLSVHPVLDYETFTAAGGIPVGATSYADWANQWGNAIVSKAAVAGVVVKPIIYTSTCGAGNLNTSVAQWPPWIANPSGLSAQTGSPWSSTPCNSSAYAVWGLGVWSVWQYSWTGSVPGIVGNVDLDVFNGTSTQMYSALVIGTNAQPISVAISPRLNRVVDVGGSLSITGAVTGPLPVAYQWYLTGAKISGANTNTYKLANAQTTNTGNYTLVITNSYSSATSSPISLVVYPIQAVVFVDSFDSNTTTNWAVNTSSSDTSATFSFDYSTLGILSAPNSTGGTTRGVQMKANLSLGAVAAVSLSPTNQSFGGDYRLHFDGWINVNGPFPSGGAGSTEFLVAGIGTAGNLSEWTGNTSADGVYFTVNGDGGSSDTSATIADYNAYIGASVQLASTGDYWAGTDSTARGNGNFYYITAIPSGHSAPALQQANYPQQTGTLNAGTFGLAWHDVIVSKRGSIVDWAIDGVRIATISNATFAANNVFVGFWDPFASLSSNNAINFGLVDNVRVEVPAIAPTISLQPTDVSVKLTSNATFTVVASGLPAPSFRWLFNGTNISGATASSYTRTNAQIADVGNYSVIISNIAGSVTSSNAALTLIPPAPAQFQLVSLQPDGNLRIVFSGAPEWSYTVETSTNLINWSTLTNLTSASGIFDFIAGSTTDDTQRFYRARSGP